MVTCLLLAAVAQNATDDAQVKMEASFLAKLPVSLSWKQLKALLPPQTTMTVTGFRAEYEHLGNHVELAGAVKGEAILLSQSQADQYVAWGRNPKAKSYPKMPLAESDRVQRIELEVCKGKAYATGDDIDIQSRVSALKSVLGPTFVPADLAGGVVINWYNPDLEYEFLKANIYGEWLRRKWRLHYLPAVIDSKPTAATYSDYAAVKLILAGQPQHRFQLSTGELYDLRKYVAEGRSARPFGWSSPEYGKNPPETICFLTGDQLDGFRLDAATIGGKRTLIAAYMGG